MLKGRAKGTDVEATRIMVDEERYVIEIDDEAVGLVISDDGSLTFHSIHPHLLGLEGHRFPGAFEATRAAENALRRIP